MSAAVEIDYERLADEIVRRSLTDGLWDRAQVMLYFGRCRKSTLDDLVKSPGFPRARYYTLASGKRRKLWDADEVKKWAAKSYIT